MTRLLLAAFALTLAGCASTGPVSWYLTPSTETINTTVDAQH